MTQQPTPPWETRCSMQSCGRPASPARTWPMYSKSTGENHPEDVSPRPICNYHYLFNTAATSRWLPASVGAAGLVAALKNAPAADASLLTAAVITAAWFVAGGLGALAAVAGVLLAFHGLVVWTGGEAA